MELAGSVAVVTGGGHGIGKALCERFAAEGATAVVVADLDAQAASSVAVSVAERGTAALAVTLDVSDERAVADLVERVETDIGPIDLFCSNAGVAIGTGIESPLEHWQRSWEVNVMAHVLAARAVVPRMVARGHGHLLNTASAAGLLTNLGAAPYSVTKHGAVAFAEWLSITYWSAGIRVSCLCPQGVRTAMLEAAMAEGPAGLAVAAAGQVLEPEQVAGAVVEGLREERFLILPHPEVAAYVAARATEHERWLRGMRRLQARLDEATGAV